MATVRIATNWKHPDRMDWVGAPTIDQHRRLERRADIPEEINQQIERAIAQGSIEGSAYMPEGTRFQWFLDQ